MSGLRVAVVGARGRLGRLACEWIAEERGMALVVAVTRDDDLAPLLAGARVQVGLDLTRAGIGAAHGLVMLRAGVRPVIGTSGVSQAQVQELDVLALDLGLGGLVVPNFSLGALALLRGARTVQGVLGDGCPVMIEEAHHAGKKDVPSGTSLHLARNLSGGDPSGDGDRVSIRSDRMPGSPASHTVAFSGSGESVRVAHAVHDPRAYKAGILLSLRYAAQRSGIAVGLEEALDAGQASGSPWDHR